MNVFKSISRDLMIPESTLHHLIRSAPYRYKVYEIKKKSGKGTRTIAQPAREVKAIQYWVVKHILHRFPVHRAAMAYRNRRNIRANAEKHASNRFLLKLDFTDFFHSITANDLVALFSRKTDLALGSEDIEYLKRILLWNRGRLGRLVMSIGAPSSPMLSNILMFNFDEKVSDFCKKRKVEYTRYADDLTFSCSHRNILREVEVQVEEICRKLEFPRLKLNKEKSVHASRKGMRRVTGLVLTNDGGISLGRDRKRIIRAQVHHFLDGSLGVEEAVALPGTLSFVNSVEPAFIERLRKSYGSSKINRILRGKT